jgi:hypothetical protein
MRAFGVSPLYDDDVSPLTSRSTSPESLSGYEYTHPRRVIPPPIQLTELEQTYLSQLEKHYNQYKNSVGSIQFITNEFINDLPTLKHILKTYTAAMECYNKILGGFINVYVFVDGTESNLIDLIMEIAKTRIQKMYRRHTIGGKRKTRKNQKTKKSKRIKKSNKKKTHSKKNGGSGKK